MRRSQALGLVGAVGLGVGMVAVVLGQSGMWALILLASLLAGLAEVGSG